MPILLIATLDTKGPEAAFVRDRFLAAGLAVTVLDAGSLGEPAFPAGVPRDEVFRAAGTTADAVSRRGDRGHAVDTAARGAAAVAVRLHKSGSLNGVMGLGGSAGTTIATAAMRALPYGVPKIMVSTLASGQVGHFVGVSDIVMVPSVVDVAGLNRVSRMILANAAAAMAGMAGMAPPPADSETLPLAATMFGVTTPCVDAARRVLEDAGREVLVFHATGTGGRCMEALVRDGHVAGVLDVTTTELADELVGGTLSAGPDRLTAAGLRGVPQVVSLGALDMVNFGPMATVPERFRGRRLHAHNANVTLMRTTPEENDRLGKEVAQKVSASAGPSAVLVPLRGVSALDREGQAFWWPEADAALFASLRHWLMPGVEIHEIDAHVNDPEFARLAAQTLLRLAGARS